MIPYLAVIRDSFREAMASRVLWLVLLLITLLLVAVAPFHWDSTTAWKVDPSEIRSLRNVIVELEKGKAPEATALQGKIWKSLRAETVDVFQKVLDDAPGPHRFIAGRLLADDLNELISKPDFYQPEQWRDLEQTSRLTSLLEQPKLSEDLQRQRNRLALEAAMPGFLRSCPEDSVAFRYAVWDIDFLPAMTRTRAEEQIDFVVMIVLPLFVGFFGIFAAVLVTAPIIPNMLASGSLNLLLSKPIARPWLFLAKFAGGCSFVFINVCYLVVGLILVLGLRFQIWKPKLLWAIPIFLFSFAIFYVVSAVSGLIWRSTVLAIALTVLFWVACTSVAATKGIMEQLIIVPDQVQDVLVTDGEVFVQRGNGAVARWNASAGKLEAMENFREANQPPFMATGPAYQSLAYDAKSEMLLALRRSWSESNIYPALRANSWKRELPTKAPKNTLLLFMRNGTPTVVNEDGVYAMSMAQAAEPLSDINIFGLRIPAPAPKDSSNRISEPLNKLSASTEVAYSKVDDRIYLQFGQNLVALAIQEDLFVETARTQVEPRNVTHIAAGKGALALIHRQDSKNSIELFDAANLSSARTVVLTKDEEVRSLRISDDGRWLAVVYEDDFLSVFNVQQNLVEQWTSKSVTAAAFDKDTLLTINRNEQLTWRSFPNAKVDKQVRSKLPWYKTAYQYVVNPLYLVFPKPGELENTMRYALTGKDTQKVRGQGMGPNGRTIKLDPWQPLYSNSAFISVVLLFGCWYFYRQDF